MSVQAFYDELSPLYHMARERRYKSRPLAPA
jgi:hypothetical protein